MSHAILISNINTTLKGVQIDIIMISLLVSDFQISVWSRVPSILEPSLVYAPIRCVNLNFTESKKKSSLLICLHEKS